MNIALLNVRIAVERNAAVTDKYGNHRNEWVPFLTCYATVSGESPREESDTGLIVDDSLVDFTLRWFAASSVIKSTEYRVLFDGDIYDILGVDHMNYKRKAVKLKCRKVRR